MKDGIPFHMMPKQTIQICYYSVAEYDPPHSVKVGVLVLKRNRDMREGNKTQENCWCSRESFPHPEKGEMKA